MDTCRTIFMGSRSLSSPVGLKKGTKMFLQILFLLCLFPLHTFCMEEGNSRSNTSSSYSSSETSEKDSSTELIEIKIDKNKRIKTLDAANVVASYKSTEWPNYTIKSSIIAEVIKKRLLGAWKGRPNKDETQLIKDLKKNNPEQYTQLVSETFAELHAEYTSTLRRLKASQYNLDNDVLKKNTKKLQQLQRGVKYFDTYIKNSDEFHNKGGTLALFFCCYIITSAVLIFTGVFSSDCWN
jgi:hypothetical protein